MQSHNVVEKKGEGGLCVSISTTNSAKIPKATENPLVKKRVAKADLERLAESKDTMVRHLRSIVRAVYHMMGDISGKVLGLNYGGKVCWNYNQGSLVSSMKRDILTSGR